MIEKRLKKNTNSTAEPSTQEQEINLLYGMIKINKQIDILEASKLSNTNPEHIKTLIYALAGEGKLEGEFDGNIFKIHSDIENFIEKLDNSFNEWQNKEHKQKNKIIQSQSESIIETTIHNQMSNDELSKIIRSAEEFNTNLEEINKPLVKYIGWGVVESEFKALKTLEQYISISSYSRLLPIPILNPNRLTALSFGLHIQSNHITHLALFQIRLREIPSCIGNLTQLKELYLGSNNLSTLPETFEALHSLEVLNLYDNHIKNIPECLSQLKKLKELNLINNPILLNDKRNQEILTNLRNQGCNLKNLF